MRINTKTRYATRALLEMVLQDTGEPINLSTVAQRQGISIKYLEYLFNALRNRQLVLSVRGPQGGYLLARPAEQITLRDIYDIFEGQEGFVACLAAPQICERAVDCVAREAWNEFYVASLKVLEGITLADLARKARDRLQQGTLHYAI